MLKLLCVLLVLPGAAMARDVGPQPTNSPTISPPRPIAARAVADRSSAADPAALCETAVASAEFAGHLPPRLLHAISLTESGRTDARTGVIRPWPWTINAEGEGQFFPTQQEAVAAVKALQARGVRSVDVGCTQINLMQHPDAFTSLEQAFDPRSNAGYAARFLNALYADGKDWYRAIAAYHSETPALGEAYRVLVLARWQNPDLRNSGHPHEPVVAYSDFAPDGQTYRSFTAAGRVYGAFSMAPR
jgi:hypothetical protein